MCSCECCKYIFFLWISVGFDLVLLATYLNGTFIKKKILFFFLVLQIV